MLYLHIGTGKAGSTTIQKFLKENRANLPYRQLETFEIGNSWKIAASARTASRNYWVGVLKKLSEQEYQDLSLCFWKDVQQEVSSYEPSDFVASSEFIYTGLGANREEISLLKQQLSSIFGRVKIIAYFRSQTDFVKSLYSQHVKGPVKETRSFQKFIENLDGVKASIFYAERITLWGEIFGWENIDAAVFDKRNFVNNNLIEDFCVRIDIEYDEQWAASHKQPMNVSPKYNEIIALRCFNLVGLRKGRGRVARVMRSIPALKEFPSRYDNLVLSKVSEGNKWLNKNVFSNQPVKLPEVE